jgi:gas vesicle protein
MNGHGRHAMLAASVVFAAGIGAVIGALALGGSPSAPKDTASLRERDAMQKSITHLNKEIASLKATIVAANKAAHSQIAKNTDRITDKLNEHAERAATPETTGSIPTPLPRPVAAAPMRPPVIGDWAIRDARNGYVYVQGHGDIYQVVPGANLPGIGPVQSITQQDGRWVVLTPRGIIVSMQDRRFFE